MCASVYGHDMNTHVFTPLRQGKDFGKSILEYLHTQNLVMDKWQQMLLYEDKNLLLP